MFLDLALPRCQSSRLVGMLAAVLVCAAASPLRSAVIPVSTLADLDVDDGECSLREAIIAANRDTPYRGCPAGQGRDRIQVMLAGDIELQAALPKLTTGLSLEGPGALELTISGRDLYQILLIDSPTDGEDFSISRLQLADGLASLGGGAIQVESGDRLTLDRVVLARNKAPGSGGALEGRDAFLTVERSSFRGNISSLHGGAISWVGGQAILRDSTISGNSAGVQLPGAVGSNPTLGSINAEGGGMQFTATEVELVRCTVSGNRAAGWGGGVNFEGGGVHRVVSSTIFANVADDNGDGDGEGGGVQLHSLFSLTEVSFVNSIIARNRVESVTGTDDPDIHNDSSLLITEGFNLIGNNTGVASEFPSSLVAGEPNLNGDFVGDLASPLNPSLSPLFDHGGFTRVHLPFPSSPAIDQGFCPQDDYDQRGFGEATTHRRPVDDLAVDNFIEGCDIGSAEALGVAIPFFSDGFESGDTARWSGIEP